jgi:hypothetical protein
MVGLIRLLAVNNGRLDVDGRLLEVRLYALEMRHEERRVDARFEMQRPPADTQMCRYRRVLSTFAIQFRHVLRALGAERRHAGEASREDEGRGRADSHGRHVEPLSWTL